MAKATVTIPTEMISELEAWGKITIRLFGKLRTQAGIKPKGVLQGQDWYWSRQWQEWEQAADEDITKGRVVSFSNVNDLLADLDS